MDMLPWDVGTPNPRALPIKVQDLRLITPAATASSTTTAAAGLDVSSCRAIYDGPALDVATLEHIPLLGLQLDIHRKQT